MLLFLSVSSKSCQKPGDVGFYPVLPLNCLLYDWLAGRACTSGWANDYRLVRWLVGDVVWKGPFLMWGVSTPFIRFVRVICHILI